MPPTLNDIAKATQTSVSTVSRVLAGGKGAARISDKTRQRVRETAAQMGYRPNQVARSLRTGRSNTVALLVSDIANPWFAQLASLVEQSLHRQGYSMILCNSAENPEREMEYLKLLPSKGIDGLIVVPLVKSRKVLLDVLPAGLPLVVLDRPIAGISTCVSSDQDQAAGLLCDMLGWVGVKEVALASGPQHVVTHRRRVEIISQRFQIAALHEGPAQKETGRQACIKFAHLGVDAIVCTNNLLAQGVIDAMDNPGESPIVACFDAIPMMNLLPIPIVCSVQDVPMLAEGCVRMLLPQLKKQEGRLEPLVLPSSGVSNPRFQHLR